MHDTLIPDPAEFLKEIEKCTTTLEQRQHELHKYLAAINGLTNFLAEFQTFIFKRLQLYRKHFMTRKNENHIRRKFSKIIMSAINSIKDATINDNIENISDVDRRFVNGVIDNCKEKLFNLGTETFLLNIM